MKVEVEGLQFEVKGWRLMGFSLRLRGRRRRLREYSLELRSGGGG